MLKLPNIRNRLAAYTPELSPTEGMRMAAVTVLLRNDRPETEVLLIERAKRDGDPWSGHMAFPGGRAEPSDPSVQKTAERETLEEVGIGLDDARCIGRLDDLSGRAAAANKMIVSAYVYEMDSPGSIQIEPSEVADALWVPLDYLVHPENHVPYPMQYGEREIMFPGVSVAGPEPRVVWGLTYRFLEIFFEVIGNPFFDHGIPDPESLGIPSGNSPNE
ncbi:MAG: 8-oxo-dGTP pyrophosphatase MutT (NUDIX family) [Myxococcota bacterium]|jgi:8-oxo-dGTP pyrophosphatase MutT (NUDIX family)